MDNPETQRWKQNYVTMYKFVFVGYILVSNTYSVVFLFFFVLCTICYLFLWIVHF